MLPPLQHTTGTVICRARLSEPACAEPSPPLSIHCPRRKHPGGKQYMLDREFNEYGASVLPSLPTIGFLALLMALQRCRQVHRRPPLPFACWGQPRDAVVHAPARSDYVGEVDPRCTVFARLTATILTGLREVLGLNSCLFLCGRLRVPCLPTAVHDLPYDGM